MSLVKSVFKVFDGKQKRKLFGMAFLILINSGVSLLGVSVLLPFIQAVTAPEELLANRYVAAFYEWMGMENPNELITAIAIGIVIVYLAKNAFIIFMNNMQYRFSYYGKREMQDRLMKYYISKDYTFFLNHNSAELMRDINNDPEMFYAAVLNMLQLAAELCTSTILIIFLVVTDPIITLGVALAMMLMVLLFMKKLKRTLARFGDERRKYNANIIQCMQQAFGGIKEIKIANRESYFEGDRSAMYRILRAVKNRFGATNEMGVFEMVQSGLKEVANPSAYLLEGRSLDSSGTVTACLMEGTRPIMLEVQALVCRTSFGLPRRTSAGMDGNRVNLLIAVLEKRMGMALSSCDAYVNVTGGIKISEPALDLAVVMAIAGSFRDRVIDAHTVIFGEVGLAGEIRGVSMVQQRINEAARLGFTCCILPKISAKDITIPEGMKCIPVATVREAAGLIEKMQGA